MLEKLSPKIWWNIFELPRPKLCPNCRQQARLSFRNERNLYKWICNATGKPIISLYHPESNYVVYSKDFWESDSWNAMDFWQEYIKNKDFFTQYKTLHSLVPKKAIYGIMNENSDYTSDCTHCKNCYLLYASDYCVDSSYGLMQNSKDSLDCNECAYLQNCYECLDCDNLYSVRFAQNSSNCNNCSYIYECKDCSDCYLCSNLIWKKYCILNKQYTKQEYFDELKKYENHEKSQELFKKVKTEAIKKSRQSINTVECDGNYIYNSKNCFHCFDISETRDSRYVYYGSLGTTDCMDTSMASLNASKCYNSQCCLENCSNIIGCNFCVNIQNSQYLDNCENCKDCFWCAGLKNKQYCILNKQYTKQEYEDLVSKIITDMKKGWIWWEFFPISLSPFWYNETVSYDYYPLSKNSVQKVWWNWSDYIRPFPQVDKIIPAENLPTNISDIPDDVLNWSIECKITKKPFRILKTELEFYRKYSLPIPRLHPDERYRQRAQLRNPRKLWKQNCNSCNIILETTFDLKIKETILCETCYNKEIY